MAKITKFSHEQRNPLSSSNSAFHFESQKSLNLPQNWSGLAFQRKSLTYSSLHFCLVIFLHREIVNTLFMSHISGLYEAYMDMFVRVMQYMILSQCQHSFTFLYYFAVPKYELCEMYFFSPKKSSKHIIKFRNLRVNRQDTMAYCSHVHESVR